MAKVKNPELRLPEIRWLVLVSAGLGVAAGSAVAGTTLVLGSTVVAPIAVGAGAAYACAKIWNKLFFNGKKNSIKKTK